MPQYATTNDLDTRRLLGDVLITFTYHPNGFEVQIHDHSYGAEYIRYAALIPFEAARDLQERIRTDQGILAYAALDRTAVQAGWARIAQKGLTL